REDGVCMNRDALIYQAKEVVLTMDKTGYRPPRPPENLVGMGDSGRALLELGIYYMEEGRQISAHDAYIGRKLAHVLTGGNVLPGSRVTEQYILDLEREAFLSLCGEEKTQDRIRYMLQKGKPLRN
ncbi:MAG: 3-hydroxyacyl-CoA dehydrogenase, partial [Deltaproteobacteria bacterium]